MPAWNSNSPRRVRSCTDDGSVRTVPDLAQAPRPTDKVLLLDDIESVYAPPEPPRPDQGVNEGGVHLNLNVTYLNDVTPYAHSVGRFDSTMLDDLANFLS